MKNEVLSGPILRQQEAYRVQAVVFTSVIAVMFLTVFALITLYGPSAAQQREEVVLLDMGLAFSPSEGNTSTVTNEHKQQSASLQTGISDAHQRQFKGQDPLPEDDQQALFPGMESQEDGTSKKGGKEPGTGTEESTNVHGTYGGNADPDYRLDGRNCLFRPVINQNIQEEGLVMVSIMVDEEGKVTRASINETQTNTNSPSLRRIALNSALKTKWTEKKGIPEQKGHIVYKFVLK